MHFDLSSVLLCDFTINGMPQIRFHCTYHKTNAHAKWTDTEIEIGGTLLLSADAGFLVKMLQYFLQPNKVAKDFFSVFWIWRTTHTSCMKTFAKQYTIMVLNGRSVADTSLTDKGMMATYTPYCL